MLEVNSQLKHSSLPDTLPHGPEIRTRGVTPRAVILGLLLLLAVTVSAFHADLLTGSGGYTSYTSGVPAQAPFAVLFLITAVATLPVGRAFRFTRRELLAVYAIVFAGAPFVSYGILGFLLPTPIYLYSAARKFPDYAPVYLHLIPNWFSPSDPYAVESFFAGEAVVPWSLWSLPLVAWSSFLLALVTASLCLVVLIQRQWITNERLSFPLAQIPLELVTEKETPQGKVARLTVARVFWMGFTLTLLIGFWNNLTTIFPSLPPVPLGPVVISPAVQVGPLAGIGDIALVLWPWMIAIAYLIPKELSLSAWVFWIVRVALAIIAISFGAQPQAAMAWLGDTAFPAYAFQGFGAILAMAVWAVWKARRHLGRAARISFSRESGKADVEEPIPYRWAFIGLAISFAWMVGFFWLSGARPIVGVIFVGLLLSFYMMWNWIRIETGLGMLMFPLMMDDMLDGFGNSILRPKEILTWMMLRWTYFPGASSTADVISGNVLESLKIADQSRIDTRSLFRAMGAGIVLALLVGVYVTLTGIYHYGFYNLRAANQSWLSSQVNWNVGHIFSALTTPSSLDLNAIAGIIAGGAVALGLGLFRARFWWWPLHPVGYLAANCWGMHWFYMPFFIGWLAKTLVTRYGGLRLYQQTVPLAIGLIAGELMSSFIWTLYRISVFG
jgi:hypothetical protein